MPLYNVLNFLFFVWGTVAETFFMSLKNAIAALNLTSTGDGDRAGPVLGQAAQIRRTPSRINHATHHSPCANPPQST